LSDEDGIHPFECVRGANFHCGHWMLTSGAGLLCEVSELFFGIECLWRM
jgi:hypothetical protein